MGDTWKMSNTWKNESHLKKVNHFKKNVSHLEKCVSCGKMNYACNMGHIQKNGSHLENESPLEIKGNYEIVVDTLPAYIYLIYDQFVGENF